MLILITLTPSCLPHISPPSTFTAAEQRRPLQRFLSSTRLRQSLFPSPSFPSSFFPFLVTVSSSPGTGSDPPAKESRAKTGSEVFSATSSRPHDRRAATERRRRRGAVPRSATMVPECGATAQWRETLGAVQRRTERLAGCRLVQVRPSSFSSHFILLKPSNSLN